MRRNIALSLTYEGSGYHGWQVQKEDITVAGVLEKALASVLGHEARLTGCGRTDAGVHAKKYVANFRTHSSIPAERLPYALNTRLPADIAVKAAFDMPDSFNAIGSCIKKEYTYLIYNSRIRDPFYVNRAYFYPRPLDEKIMAEAAWAFVGTHDFKAVRSVGSNVKTTVRTVHYFKVAREGDLVSLSVCANGFLYNMARAMAGTLIYVSEGKLRVEDIAKILKDGSRTDAGPTVPAGGLYLTDLWYGEEAAHIV